MNSFFPVDANDLASYVSDDFNPGEARPSNELSKKIYESLSTNNDAMCRAMCYLRDAQCNMYAHDGSTCYLGDANGNFDDMNIVPLELTLTTYGNYGE